MHLSDLGISPSPLENADLLQNDFPKESEAIESNIQVFSSMLDYLREAVEIFFIIRRQKDKRALEEKRCNELLQNVTKARYNLGELIENIRIFEKNLGKTVKRFSLIFKGFLRKKYFEITKKTNIDTMRIMSVKSENQGFFLIIIEITKYKFIRF